MKKISFIIIFFCFKISFGQKLAKLNLKDSCVISGGVMSVADFNRVCKVCPEGMKKVTSYSISHTVNHMAVDFPLKNGRWKSSFLQKPGMGTILVIENIKGIDAKGKPLTAAPMVIGLK